MDRVTRAPLKVWIVIAVFFYAAAGHPTWAGGVERFPESRFGSPPAVPVLGVGSGYAVRAVEWLEAPSSDLPEVSDVRENGGTRRAPAGLEISAKGSETVVPASKTQPVLAPQLAPPAVNPTSTASAIARKGVQEVALIAGDLGFFPKTVFVSRDVPVRLFVTGASKNTLCIMMDSFDVRRQIRSQKIEEITFTPETPGKFRFYCPVNGMEGALIVKEFASNQSDTSGSEATGE